MTDAERASLGTALDVSLAGVCVGDRAPRADEIFVALREGASDTHSLTASQLTGGAPLAIVARDSPHVSELPAELRARCLVVDDTLAAFRALAGALRARLSCPVIAVGGSNGKTTVKDMLAAMLGANGRRATRTRETMNGWTGLPFTLLSRAHTRALPPHAVVVEIGIDERGAMCEHARLVDADVCVLTALGPEHLAGLVDAETAAREELTLFAECRRARRVYQATDARIRRELVTARDADIVLYAARFEAEIARRDIARLVYDVRAADAVSSDVSLAFFPRGATAATFRGVVRVPMAGLHHGDNFATAFAAGLQVGRAPEELLRGFRAFAPPAMRCEVRELSRGCTLIDDAYNASPESMRAALELVASPTWGERPRVLVLADMLDLGDTTARYHAELVAPLAALVANGARVQLVGDALLPVARALGEQGANVTHHARGAAPAQIVDGVSLDSAVVLVKGSRGMHLEHVTAEIARRADRTREFRVTGDERDLLQFRGRFATAAVTGTNGKTTTTSLIAAIVAASGEVPCRSTTLGSWVAEESIDTELTGNAFIRTLARAAERGVKTVAVETTSHALEQGFAKTWPADVAVFTNLSRDHLDYHGSPEAYLAAKAQLFIGLSEPSGVAVLNLADPASALLHEVIPASVRRMGYAARAIDAECTELPKDLVAESVVVDRDGTHVRLCASPLADAFGGRLDTRLIGHVHAENALAAALAGLALGYAPSVIRDALLAFRGVPGRFEVVHARPLVVVDYAHTPDALARTLMQARALVSPARGRVLVVTGCGGDRDPGKRAPMGATAATRADVVCITTDNPRGEDPQAIADEIARGAEEGPARILRISDRAEAIARTIELAHADDIVVIAGKGHEKTQVIGDSSFPFDDVEIATSFAEGRDHEG